MTPREPSEAAVVQALAAHEQAADAIVGFSYGEPPDPWHVIRDVSNPDDERVLWTGRSTAEFHRQYKVLRMKAALRAAYAVDAFTDEEASQPKQTAR